MLVYILVLVYIYLFIYIPKLETIHLPCIFNTVLTWIFRIVLSVISDKWSSLRGGGQLICFGIAAAYCKFIFQFFLVKSYFRLSKILFPSEQNHISIWAKSYFYLSKIIFLSEQNHISIWAKSCFHLSKILFPSGLQDDHVLQNHFSRLQFVKPRNLSIVPLSVKRFRNTMKCVVLFWYAR